jgi:hypothetical protein
MAGAEQARRLMANVDWPSLTENLRTRRLLTVLGPRILELSGGRPGEDLSTVVEEALETGRRQSVFLQLTSHRAMEMLADAGVRSSALKGPNLGEAIYGDPGRRLSSDIDLLVSPEELPAAVEVVRRLGYAAPTDYVFTDGLPLLHFVLVHERGQLPPVELHWRVHWYERNFARERLLPPTVDQMGRWRPKLVDELAALLLFYARDGFIDLRIATDLSAWWDVHGADFPSGGLDGLLSDYPALSRVIPAAAEVAQRIVGLPAKRVIGDRHGLDLRGRVAVRLADPNPRSSRSQLYADMGLIDGLLAPHGGFGGFVRRQLLPPSEVRDQQARHGSRRRARSSLGRCTGALARYGITMTHLLRRPETQP